MRSAPTTIKLAFKGNMPLLQEHALIHIFGFKYVARKKDEWVIYERPVKVQGVDYSNLSDDVVAELNRKVNKIASSFQNPDAHKDVIRVRCENLARTLTPKQRAWVMSWIKRVIDEEEDDTLDTGKAYGSYETPWIDDEKIETNAEFLAQRGFC